MTFFNQDYEPRKETKDLIQLGVLVIQFLPEEKKIELNQVVEHLCRVIQFQFNLVYL